MNIESRQVRRSRQAKQRRKYRVRKKICGSGERPRMSVTLTQKHMYVQFHNDQTSRTICSVSTLSKDFDVKDYQSPTVNHAFTLGTLAGRVAKEKKIHHVVFDRNAKRYHGRVKAIADGARKTGLVC